MGFCYLGQGRSPQVRYRRQLILKRIYLLLYKYPMIGVKLPSQVHRAQMRFILLHIEAYQPREQVFNIPHTNIKQKTSNL
jgi:hypothetical protein